MTQGFTNQQTYAVLPPTIQKFTSGSGTYTLPSGVKYIVVEMVGGGGGGGGSTSSNNGGTGGTGGTTTFGTSLLTCTGGAGGTGTTQSVGGAGGTATLNSPAVGVAFDGARGSAAQEGQGVLTAYYFLGGDGAQSPFGGAGPGYVNAPGVGYSAAANTGSGGGGAGPALGGIAGKGGGAGAYIKAIISSPSASYSYAVGAAGTAGAAGTSGSAGGAGAAGIIIVTEYYDTIGIPSNLTLPVPVNQGGTGVTNNNWTAGSLTFSPTTQGIVGTTTNDSAGAGYVGEFVSSVILVGSKVTLTANVAANITSISLTAGDWDVWGNVNINTTAQTQTYSFAWISTTSATQPADAYIQGFQMSQAVIINNYRAITPLRFSLNATTTVYLSVVGDGGGTLSGWGAIYARRVR